MTTEEKAKAYDEALERAKANFESSKTMGFLEIADTIVDIFPELRESEDERIRKEIISALKFANDGGVYDKHIAYLEKQKEPKHDATDAKSERVIKAARRVLNNWLDGTDCPDVSGAFVELEYAIRKYDGDEKQKESLHIPEMCKENADSFTDEDERIREFLIDLLSHGTWKKDWPFSPAECVAWLEKQKEPENISASTMAPSCWELEQKEQKPVEPSDEELERHQKELYDFKVFATKQAREHHISFVHDFEWNNFCAELLSYFNEKQKPVEIHIDNPNIEKFDSDVKITTSDSSANGDELLYVCNKSYKIGYRDGKRDAEQKSAEYIPDSVKFSEGYKTGREVGFREGVESVKPAEWSEEDEKRMDSIINILCCYKANLPTKNQLFNVSFQGEVVDADISWLKSLPLRCQKSAGNWKPSIEQMWALLCAIMFMEIKASDYDIAPLKNLYGQLKKLM